MGFRAALGARFQAPALRLVVGRRLLGFGLLLLPLVPVLLLAGQQSAFSQAGAGALPSAVQQRNVEEMERMSRDGRDLGSIDISELVKDSIEDDQEAARFLSKGLKESGHTVDLAADGDDGLHLGLTGSFDVLVVDRMLPGRDGLTVIAALRAAGVKTPALSPYLVSFAIWIACSASSARLAVCWRWRCFSISAATPGSTSP